MLYMRINVVHYCEIFIHTLVVFCVPPNLGLLWSGISFYSRRYVMYETITVV
jgi:hypothetical protein